MTTIMPFAKKATLLLIMSLMAFSLSMPKFVSAEAATGGLRYTISVVKFDNQAGWAGQWDIGDAWGTVMTDVLNQTGRFIVLGEKDMRGEALDEQALAASGATAQGSITPAQGRLTPAQILVKGAITHVQETGSSGGGISFGGISLGGSSSKAEINVTMYMVDSTTGQILASTSVVGKSSAGGAVVGYSGPGWSGEYGNFQKSNVGKAVQDAISQGTQWMISQLPNIPWRGTVALIKNGSIYVNRGTREGVTVGQTFVVGKADIITDPDTGEILDESINEIARIKVISVKEKISICQVISGNPAAITLKMAVQLP